MQIPIPRIHDARFFPWTALLALLALGAADPASALSCNDKPNRYRERDVFPTLKETPNIQYGQNKNPLFNNQTVNLLADIFEPANDTCSKRPLVIFMWGGGFQTGTRKDETGTCRQFAKRGFVSAAIDYRMGVNGVQGATNFATPAFMSTQDTRAAVRFFRKNAAQYRIDTNLIYVGGCSSGAYAAMWTGYLDQLGEIPPEVVKDAQEGGIEGNSGNPGFSSKFAGVLSLSGAVHDTNWINTGDVPMAMVQCAGDPTVHPEGGIGTGSKFQYYGATAVAARASHVGVPKTLLTYAGACHCPRPTGPTGLDSTVDFFAKSAYGFMTAPPTTRIGILLFERDRERLAAAHGGGSAQDAYDVKGKIIKATRSPAQDHRGSGFSPGLYFRKDL
jgi:hypothetical protein